MGIIERVSTFIWLVGVVFKNAYKRVVTGDWRVQKQIDSIRKLPFVVGYVLKNGAQKTANLFNPRS